MCSLFPKATFRFLLSFGLDKKFTAFCHTSVKSINVCSSYMNTFSGHYNSYIYNIYFIQLFLILLKAVYWNNDCLRYPKKTVDRMVLICHITCSENYTIFLYTDYKISNESLCDIKACVFIKPTVGFRNLTFKRNICAYIV